MLSYIPWNVSPDIFTIPEFLGFGPFTIRWYGLLFAAGFLFGQQVMTHIFKKEGKPLEDIDTLTLVMVFSTVLGARLGHFLFYEPSVFVTNPLEDHPAAFCRTSQSRGFDRHSLGPVAVHP